MNKNMINGHSKRISLDGSNNKLNNNNNIQITISSMNKLQNITKTNSNILKNQPFKNNNNNNNNILQENQKKQHETCFNTRNNTSSTQTSLQDQQQQKCNSQSNLSEECIQEMDENHGILTHSLQTKRNTLMKEKENELPMKMKSDQLDWKQKYNYLNQQLQEKNQQLFIHERQINQLQIQLLKEKNLNKSIEKNKSNEINKSNQSNLLSNNDLLENVQNKLKTIEIQLEQSQQQNLILKNQLSYYQQNTPIKQQEQQIFSEITSPNSISSSSSKFVSLRKKSSESKFNYTKSKSKDRQSLCQLENKKQSDDQNQQKIQLLQGQDLFNATKQNKSLLLKISDLEKQIQFLLENKSSYETNIQSLQIENNVLQNKFIEYSRILNSIDYFNYNNQNNQNINNNGQNYQQQQQQYNQDFNQNRMLSDIAQQKNDHFQSISDQSITHKLSNLSEQVFFPDTNTSSNAAEQILFQKEFNDIRQRTNHQMMMMAQMNIKDDIQKQNLFVKDKQYNNNNNPYLDEIQFVQDNGENTYRLSKLCSC